MATIVVNPEDVRGAATKFQTTRSTMESELQQVQGQIDGLAGAWQGSAQEAFGMLMARYHQQQQAMNQLLEQVSQLMNGAATGMEDNDARYANLFHQIMNG